MAGVTIDHSGTGGRQRWFEIAGIVLVTVLLTLISRLETRLYELSSQLARDDSFIASIFFYAIINLNVFLAIILSFLVVRNIAKLVVERRRGVFGSQLRTKLVATLMVFALTPTVIIFYVSTRFISESFDEWFGGRVRDSLQQARDAGGQIYAQDQKRLEGIARLAAAKVRVMPAVPLASASQGGAPVIEVSLGGFELEYGVHSVRVFDRNATLVWSSAREQHAAGYSAKDRQFVGSLLGRFATRPGLVSSSVVEATDRNDVVSAAVPIYTSENKELVGIVLVEEHFEMPFLKNLEAILESFSRLKPGAQLVRVSYLILVTVMTLMIVFAAVWFGFRVARTIIGPIQVLAAATKEVALGNYAVTLEPQSDDETGQLIKAFNTMTADLEQHRRAARDAQFRLEISNDELERRRRYMEIVFSNIAAGVIAVDASGVVTAFNIAAQSMLGLPTNVYQIVGRPIQEVLGPVLGSVFWDEVMSSWQERSAIATRNIDLRPAGIDLALFVAATVVRSEQHDDLGMVVVFDDATQRAKQQRVIAWREVASRIAHEIKNPITPIKLSAERLLRRFAARFDGDDREVFESCTKSILVQVEFLKELVNEFGQFAKLPQVRMKPSSLSEVILKAVEIYKQGYPNIHFNVSLDANLSMAMLDEEQMHRALVNLFGNSVDAIKDNEPQGGGFIHLTAWHETSTSKFFVDIKDNGHGIPGDIKDRVFEPYVSSKKTGTGLGLAITSQIITEHGGSIRVMQTDATGTTIRITLPSGQIRDERGLS